MANDFSTPDLQAFSTLLHRSAALWRVRIDERLRPLGLTQATWRTLWALRKAAGRHHQTSLAEQLGIETPTLVPMLDRMEKKGLIRREPDPGDRRRKFVTITEEGLAIADLIEMEIVAVRARMLAGFAPAEIAAGSRLLERIIANAAEGGEDPGGLKPR